jgi:hypothetical protein
MKNLLAIALALFAASIVGAAAEIYPARPITIVVPFPAGGPTDALARVLAERMKGALGQSVIVENPTGAAGTIGTGRVARAGPDGYTVILGHWQTHVDGTWSQDWRTHQERDPNACPTGGAICVSSTPNSSGQSRPLAPAPAASQHFGEIEARSADLSKVDKTRAEWA